MTGTLKRRVLIVYRFLPQYRVDFYNGLRHELAKNSVTLHLCYGKLTNNDATKGDEVDLDWARLVDNKTISIGGLELYWNRALQISPHTIS